MAQSQEDTITSGWELIRHWQENAKTEGIFGMMTDEGFDASFDRNDGRPIITVKLASVHGDEDIGYKTVSLGAVFYTADDGYRLLKPEYRLEVSGCLPGSGRADYNGVRASIEQIVTYSGENLNAVFRALTRTGVEGQALAGRVRERIAGTKYEAMLT